MTQRFVLDPTATTIIDRGTQGADTTPHLAGILQRKIRVFEGDVDYLVDLLNHLQDKARDGATKGTGK